MKNDIPYRFPILQIKDKYNGDIHTYGTDSHDALMLDENGNVMYYNLQNGDGTGENGRYEFAHTPDERGYDGIKEIYSQTDNQIKEYVELSKEQLVWQCLVKDLQIRQLLKVGEPDET